MSVGRICVRTVYTAATTETVRAAARRMAERDTGTLIVLDDERRPIGIVSDRDVMHRCVARGENADEIRVGELMTSPVNSVREDTPIEDALRQMADHRVRRLAVVDEKQCLVGILALDDVLELLAEESATIGRLLGRG